MKFIAQGIQKLEREQMDTQTETQTDTQIDKQTDRRHWKNHLPTFAISNTHILSKRALSVS